MKVTLTERGFQIIEHESRRDSKPERLVQMSSAIGEYEDAFDRPGTSALWIGDRHHLDREQVAELRDHLTRWLETGELGKVE